VVVLFQGTCFRFHISCLGCRCVLLMIFFLLCHISHVLCWMSGEVKASKAMTESINPPIHSPCWMPTGRDHGDHDSSKSGCLERFYKIWSMFNLRRSTSIVVLSPIYSVCHAIVYGTDVLRLSLPRLVRWGVHRVRLLQVEEALAHRRAMAGRKMGTKRKRGPNVPRYFELGGGEWKILSETKPDRIHVWFMIYLPAFTIKINQM